MSHDHDHDTPLCRVGQGSSRRDIFLGDTTRSQRDKAHAALMAEGIDDEWAATLVAIHDSQAIFDGLKHITYDARGRRVVRFALAGWDGEFAAYVLPVRRAEQPVPPLLTPRAQERIAVGAGVAVILIASLLWSPWLALGAAAMAAVFAVACWAGGGK